MIKHDGIYFPDGERHLPEWMGKMQQRRNGVGAYQLHKYLAALELCAQRRVAVDVGANVGLWAFQMARDFQRVACFEPVPRHLECLRANLAREENVDIHAVALGQESGGTVSLHNETEGSCGDTCIATGGTTANAAACVPLRALDDFNLQRVDLLKVDVEGYELPILEGGLQTLRRCRPVVIVEQKPGNAQKFGLKERQAVDFLMSIGAELRAEISGDFIMSWEGVRA